MGKKLKAKSSKRRNAKKLEPKSNDCSHSESSSACQTLVAHAESALSQMQMEDALGYYEQALSIDTRNCDVMDTLADIYLSLGETGRAFELLIQSSQISPEENPGKYLYIAQLQQGEEALASYKQALHFLSLLRGKSEEAAVMMIDKQLIKSYCGIAELYMTDLCFNENAEEQCNEAVSQALAIDSTSIDANHVLANIRLSQNNPMDAAVLVEGVFKNIHDIRERINARTVVEELRAPARATASENIGDDPEDEPSLEICVSTVKLMLECATAKPSLAEEALLFAAELLNDNDENVELWYIAGVAALTTVPPDFSVALHYFEQAKSMIDAFREFPDFEDGAMDEHYSLILDHIAMIHSQQQGENLLDASGEERVVISVAAAPTGSNRCSVGDIGTQEEWSSDDEDDGDPMDII